VPSDETKNEAAVALLACNAFISLTVMGTLPDTREYIGLSVAFALMLIVGGRLYVSVPAGCTGVPLTDRWRTAGLITASATLALLATIVWSARMEWISATPAVVVSVFAVYFFRHARAGYRESRPQGET
jgi:hypothetical protein